MASRELERIRNAILDRQYTLTEHAYEEMEEETLMYSMSNPRFSLVRLTRC